MDRFNRVIPLIQLTELTLCWVSNVSDLVDILLHIPNIYTLSFAPNRSSVEKNFELQESDTFKLVSKQNRIQNVIISPCSLETIQIIVKLCTRLQHLTFIHPEENIERVVRFLFLKHDPTVCHLSSLRILRTNPTVFKK
jgi:hypothetical protein